MKGASGVLRVAAVAALVGVLAIGITAAAPKKATRVPPGAVIADSLIREGETHFAHLWQITFGGENAEAYWSGDGTRLIFQRTGADWPCDQEYVMDLVEGHVTRVSNGLGRTTCGYFYDKDQRILFSSTHLASDSCPPPPDYSQGYVWPVSEGYDIFTAKPDGSDLQRLTLTPGYDAEATVSVDGSRIVFTSVRDGDLEVYTMKTDGTGVRRLTNKIGYDGGAFFSRDGKWICFRSSYPSDSAVAEYQALLARHLVRPTQMNLWVMRADGSDARQITDKPGASFAPYFTPDGKSLIYSSNWENPKGRNFDLYLVPVKGGEPVAVTRDPSFDGFPMYSPDGRWLVFASNRGAKVRGETNIFLAQWR
jgi:Tol biopolymer transport system component